jgi:hypothetical protein
MRRTVVLALSTLLLTPLTPSAAPSLPAPVAILYSLTGEVSRTDPGQRPRAAKLFDLLPAGTTLEAGSGSRASLAFASGLRWMLGGGGGRARITLGKTGLAGHSGDVQSLAKLPRLPRLLPIRKEDHAGQSAGAVTIRGERITGLYPARGATAVAGAVVLRFQPVGGTERYRIEVRDEEGRIVYAAETAVPALTLPSGSVRPGAVYLWNVCTVDRAGPVARGEAELTTLNAETARAREELRQLAEKAQGDELTILLAGLDWELGLLAEAREELRSALRAAPSAPLAEALADLERRMTEEGLAAEN